MPAPLRLTALRITPEEVEELTRAIEGAGLRVETRWVDRPGELAGIAVGDSDVIVASHALPDSDLRRWLPLLCRDDAPPAIVVIDRADSGAAGGLQESGAFEVVIRGSAGSLSRAIGRAIGRSGIAMGSDPERDESGFDRRRMAALMGVIGHNLRDSLGAITNAVEVLSFQCGEGTLGQRRTIEFLDRQSRKMAGLLDDYAEIVRITADPIATSGEVIELGVTLDRAIDQARLDVFDGGPTFERRPRADLIWLIADARRLEQMVRHALRYVRRAEPSSETIRIDWKESAGRFELVFESAPASGAAAVPPRLGIDLDLFLIESLVDRLGGSVRSGTPFVIELPGSVVSRPEVAGEDRTKAIRRPGSNRHALLVDDNPESVHALGLLIGRLGWHVRVTADISEALGMIRTFRPEVVLIDLHMPLMSGQALSRRIRRDFPDLSPLLIGISGSVELSASEVAETTAFDHFLLKPVRREQIAALLPPVGAGPTA